MKEVETPPSAAALIESMRDFGYSLETAIADIVDNSITAGARTISILSELSEGGMRIAIADDGCGMTGDELLSAMQPGSSNPLVRRERSDLGRFGLGLKTASFSQCRRVTVMSHRSGETSAIRWDLDLVQERDKWVVQVIDDLTSLPWIDRLGEHGTIVLWEVLDRLVGDSTESTSAEFREYLNSRLTDVSDHLAMVYHRFLVGERGIPRVRMTLNHREIEPFDPFNSEHPATVELPPEYIDVRTKEGLATVEVQAYVLPYFKKVSQVDWERFAGPGGYLKNQGFYVYREKRLIIHGTWFGLARQKAATQLSRVRIDIGNELDSEWKIDVRKASAQLPFVVRKRLKEILEQIEVRSRQPITGRGYVEPSLGLEPVWRRVVKDGDVTYGVNAAHPAIEEFANELAPTQAKTFIGLIRLISAALPIDPIYSDLGSNPEKVCGERVSLEILDSSIEVLIRRLKADGLAAESILEVLKMTPPYGDVLNRDAVDVQRMIGGE